jgi:hypothetical protein
VNPESTLGVPIMLDVLLMVIIGGLGTLYGGIVGAVVLLAARTLLPDLRALETQLVLQELPVPERSLTAEDSSSIASLDLPGRAIAGWTTEPAPRSRRHRGDAPPAGGCPSNARCRM